MNIINGLAVCCGQLLSLSSIISFIYYNIIVIIGSDTNTHKHTNSKIYLLIIIIIMSLTSSYSYKNSFRYVLLLDPQYDDNDDVNHDRDDEVIIINNKEQTTTSYYYYRILIRIISFILVLLFGFVSFFLFLMYFYGFLEDPITYNVLQTVSIPLIVLPLVLILIRIAYVLLYIALYDITPKSMSSILLDWFIYGITPKLMCNNNIINSYFRVQYTITPQPYEMVSTNSSTPKYNNNDVNNHDEDIIMNEEQTTLYHYPMSFRIVSFTLRMASFILALLFGFVSFCLLVLAIVLAPFIVYGTD